LFKLFQGLISQFWRNARTGKTVAGVAPAAGDDRTLVDIDALIGRGDLDAAEQALAVLASLRPADADVAMLRARLAVKRGDRQCAIKEFELAIALQPALAAAHIELGTLYSAAGHLDEARARYEAAARLEPDIAELHNNLGVACLDAGHFDGAQRSFERALQLRPEFTVARNNLGRVYRERGDYAAALDIFRALAGDFHARVNTGLVLNNLGDCAQAYAVLAECVRERPDNTTALCGLGEACCGLGRVDEAEIHYRAAGERDPASATVRFALGNIALLRGDFAAGWPLYEARTELAKFARHYVRDIPEWAGEPLPGRTLLVYSEQGYGDVLLFARFLPLLAAARATVVFRCRRALVRLLAGSSGVDRVVVAEEREVIEADAAVPLLTLGLVLRVARPDLPGTIPYIRAPEQAAMAWRERLARDVGVRVGLAWAGNPDRAHDRNRVPGADAYAMLGQVAGVSYYNLQPGHDAAVLACLQLRLIDHSSELKDFAETAALIANLDLVISVDTSVAHLAGAMGKPTLLLHSGTPDWRWAIAGVDSPWYPTVKIFRRAGAQWDTALADVARALALFAATRLTDRLAPSDITG
jgi:Flp pilus assembly protein TadD